LLLVAGCPGGDGNGDSDSEDNNDSGGVVDTTTYYGRANIIIDYYDYDFLGNLFLIEQKSYQYDVELVTGPPKNVGSVFVQNAFNLQVGTTTMGTEGTFGISSAILNVALQGSPVLLEYWDFDYVNNLIDGQSTDGTRVISIDIQAQS